MGIVSTITLGSVVHSVYALTSDPLQDAKDYMNGRFGTAAWDAASNNSRRRAIISATRWLDRQPWLSTPTDVVTPQPLENPRLALEDCNGTAVLDTIVANDIVEAQWELAQIILADSTAQESAGQGTNLKPAKAGPAEVEFFRNTEGPSRDTRLPTIPHDLIKCFIGGSGLGIPHVGGPGTASIFLDTNTSSFNRGLS